MKQLKMNLLLTTIILIIIIGLALMGGCKIDTAINGNDNSNTGNGTGNDNTTGITGFSIVDSGQEKCYNAQGTEIPCTTQGTAFYGQDAQYTGNVPSFIDNGDGTVTDKITGLMWQKSPDSNSDGTIDGNDKMTYDEAVAGAGSINLGGYTDWRLPTIKELYSLIDFRGTDPSGFNGLNTSGMIPFIDTAFFDFA